jgi:predicted transport protein
VEAHFIKVQNLNDPLKRAKEEPEEEENGCFRMSFEMTSKSDIEYALSLIKQAYEYMSSNN